MWCPNLLSWFTTSLTMAYGVEFSQNLEYMYIYIYYIYIYMYYIYILYKSMFRVDHKSTNRDLCTHGRDSHCGMNDHISI